MLALYRCGRQAEALSAYRAGRWEEALEKWRGIAAKWLDDPVAKGFIARLEAWKDAGWPQPWDGVTTLESK